MLITKRDPLTGALNSLELNINQAQLDEFNSHNGRMIQVIMPDISANEREFLMTGLTQDSWDEIFPASEEA